MGQQTVVVMEVGIALARRTVANNTTQTPTRFAECPIHEGLIVLSGKHNFTPRAQPPQTSSPLLAPDPSPPHHPTPTAQHSE